MAFDGRLLSGVTVLAAVVEGGNFTRAGEALGLSPSGVSRAIARLEQRVGVRLLDRSTRSLRLTGEGARLYERAAPLLAGIEEAASDVAGTAEQVTGTLRASVNAIVARHLIAPRLPEFTRAHPALDLILSVSPSEGDLITEGVDIAIRFGPQPPSTMVSRFLLETRVITVVAPSYLERHGTPAHPADLVGHECLQFIDPQGGRPFVWEYHRNDEVLPVAARGRLTFTDPDTMVEACVAGAGIAQVLALSVERELGRGTLTELFTDWPDETFPLYAIRPSRRFAPAKVELFLAFCLEATERYRSG